MPAPNRNQLLFRRAEYRRRVLQVRPSAFVAHWMFDEPSGSTIGDASGNGRTGTYTACTLAQPGIGDGRTSISLDGSTSFGNIYSTSLRDAFNKDEGTLIAWAKVATAGVWTDSTERRIITLRADNNNQLGLRRLTSTNNLGAFYTAGGTAKSATLAAQGAPDWFMIGLTWSKSADEVRAYLNGAQPGATLTGLGTWAGTLATTTAVIGASITTPLLVWSGWLAHVALWNVALSGAEIARIGRR